MLVVVVVVVVVVMVVVSRSSFMVCIMLGTCVCFSGAQYFCFLCCLWLHYDDDDQLVYTCMCVLLPSSIYHSVETAAADNCGVRMVAITNSYCFGVLVQSGSV